MGVWVKPKLFTFLSGGLYKDKDLTHDCDCPWRSDCQQHVFTLQDGRKVERDHPLPAKLKVIERLSPLVNLYQCGYCGLKFMYSVEGYKIPEDQRAVMRNPSLIGGRKTFGKEPCKS